MKYSRSHVESKTHAIPNIKFEHHQLTSFAGLAVWQAFLDKISFKDGLQRCFRHLQGGKIYTPAKIFLQLVLHLLLGYRNLRDSVHYRDDPMIKRLLSLQHLPDVATISRMLGKADEKCIKHLRQFLAQQVLERLQKLSLARVTLDFDGSVQSTQRWAEGTAVGFNKKKKGARSYYPLFCTVAQTGQVLAFLHRPGNVHDSRGAQEFITECINMIRDVLPRAVIEVRADSAFFSDKLISMLQAQGVQFSISVPFERFVELKHMIESRFFWFPLDTARFFFERTWRPKSWQQSFRFVFIRKQVAQRSKAPVQLDLFVPQEKGFEYKVVITNKPVKASHLLSFHDGRGSQEGIFSELKSHCAMGHVPVRRKLGNQMYLLAGLFAHNLVRELQMQTTAPSRGTVARRATLWAFESVDTIRKTLLQRAGKLTRPQGKLTLTISAAGLVKQKILKLLSHFAPAA